MSDTVQYQFWMTFAFSVAICRAAGNNFCYSCESKNGSQPDCDVLNPNIELYLVFCTVGYCTKTSRSVDGIPFYTLRTCSADGSSPEDFQCRSVEETAGYVEVQCECDENYCNEAAPRWRQSLPSAVFVLLTGAAAVVVVVTCHLGV